MVNKWFLISYVIHRRMVLKILHKFVQIVFVAFVLHIVLLQLESPSSLSPKLHTVAASNNRDHPTRSLCMYASRYIQSFTCSYHHRLHATTIIACSRRIYIYGCCSSCTTHSWWITHSTQSQLRSSNNIPSFLQWTTPITRSFCGGCTWHNLHIILVIAPFCCVAKQSFTLWQQATIEITWQDHFIIASSRHIYMGVILHAHPVRGESHIQRNANGEVATV